MAKYKICIIAVAASSVHAQYYRLEAPSIVSPKLFPDPSGILKKLGCSVLTDKKKEDSWVEGFCNIGPNPALPECITEVKTQWEKFAAKCSAEPDVNSAIAGPELLPDPSDILKKLGCSVLTDKKKEDSWVEGFCSIGPNPALPECITEVKTQWEKFAAKCSAEPDVTSAIDGPELFPDPSGIFKKLGCSVLTNKKKEDSWVEGFCNIGPNPELPECIREVKTQWEKFAAKCSLESDVTSAIAGSELFPDPSSILKKLGCSVLTNKKKEDTWAEGFCNIGPNPALPECIKEVKAQWEKLASKCLPESVIV